MTTIKPKIKMTICTSLRCAGEYASGVPAEGHPVCKICGSTTIQKLVTEKTRAMYLKRVMVINTNELMKRG